MVGSIGAERAIARAIGYGHPSARPFGSYAAGVLAAPTLRGEATQSIGRQATAAQAITPPIGFAAGVLQGRKDPSDRLCRLGP
jgi:hypothetical protein